MKAYMSEVGWSWHLGNLTTKDVAASLAESQVRRVLAAAEGWGDLPYPTAHLATFDPDRSYRAAREALAESLAAFVEAS